MVSPFRVGGYRGLVLACFSLTFAVSVIAGCGREAQPERSPSQAKKNETTAPTPVTSTQQEPPAQESRWTLVARYTLLDLGNQGGSNGFTFTTHSPHALVSWARFNRVIPEPGSSLREAFQWNITGPKNSLTVGEDYFKESMSGHEALQDVGGYHIAVMTGERFAIEVYEPSNPMVLPPGVPPAPTLTSEETRALQEADRIASMKMNQAQRDAQELVPPNSDERADSPELQRRMAAGSGN